MLFSLLPYVKQNKNLQWDYFSHTNLNFDETVNRKPSWWLHYSSKSDEKRIIAFNQPETKSPNESALKQGKKEM
jgi:hypothetical protein